MKVLATIALATAAVVGFAGAAMAADLAAPAAAPAPAPASSWDGAYIGAHVGGGWGTITDPASFATSGWRAGAQIGGNFHLSDSVVGGVEVQGDWTNEGNSTVPFTDNWDAAALARLGLDAGQWMPYIEGGGAVASATFVGTSATYFGWTVGAGVQVMLSDNLSADLQYRYTNYGTATFAGTPVTFVDNTATIGLDWHF